MILIYSYIVLKTVGFASTLIVDKAFPSRLKAVLSENRFFLSYLTKCSLLRSHLQRKNKPEREREVGGGKEEKEKEIPSAFETPFRGE